MLIMALALVPALLFLAGVAYIFVGEDAWGKFGGFLLVLIITGVTLVGFYVYHSSKLAEKRNAITQK